MGTSIRIVIDKTRLAADFNNIGVCGDSSVIKGTTLRPKYILGLFA